MSVPMVETLSIPNGRMKNRAAANMLRTRVDTRLHRMVDENKRGVSDCLRSEETPDEKRMKTNGNKRNIPKLSRIGAVDPTMVLKISISPSNKFAAYPMATAARYVIHVFIFATLSH